MKLFLNLTTRQFVRSAASSAPLARTFFKRRDKVQIEIIFIERAIAVPVPPGTTFLTGLKTGFADAEFLALTDSGGLLNLYTPAIEALFASDPVSVSALLEVKTMRPGEEARTSSLSVDIENSVILGDEGMPSTVPSLKATAAEAAAGSNNEKWMTPLRTAEAIAALGSPPATWADLAGKPAEFPPSSHAHPTSQIQGLQSALDSKAPSTHTHTSSEILDFSAAVAEVSPPANWATLTGKPDSFPPQAHSHFQNDIIGLSEALAAKMSALIAKSAVAGSTIYTGRAAPATTESSPGWTIRRSITNSAGAVISSGTANGAWSNRDSLTYS